MHKLDALINIITNKKQGKFLVFSNYEDTFEAIKKKLKEEKISYGVLKNATGKLIDDFKNGKISVLMLNAHFFGAGMNLQFASDVVLYHRFTKEMEEQVIGRAQRIGRTEQLTVHYLLHSNENNFIEEENAGAIENNYIAYLEND